MWAESDPARGVALSEAKGTSPESRPLRFAQGDSPGRMRSSLERILRVVRKVSGMPDYGAYVEHLQRCHPERPLPSPRQFYEEFVRARYADGPTRCC